MLVDDHPLELDESELFEDDSLPMSTGAPASLPASAAPVVAAAPAPAALPQSDSESESDDDGIVLESECSSSEAEDEVEEQLASRIQSLQSSLEGMVVLQEAAALGTSHSSQVGSLKSFGTGSFIGKRLFRSESDLAASVPTHVMHGATAPMYATGRRVAPAPVADKASQLGTSMPISIPLMQRRASAADLASIAAEDARQPFVPPHMLYRQESVDQAALGEQPSLGLSPSAAAKREKLLARNAILRSTGFIEVQAVPAVIGSVLDPVRDQLLGSLATPGSTAVAVPGSRPDSRSTPRSSLTQLLGTSK